MRDELDNEIHSTGRRDSPLRRLGVPIVAAAAVVAAAIGGYALLGGNGRDLAPAATTKPPKPSPTVSTTQRPRPTSTATPTKPQTAPRPSSAEAYRSCINLVSDSPHRNLSGKLAIDNGKGITVVVANRTDAYTCNIKPDSAVSSSRPLDSAVGPEAFAVAHNVTRNFVPGDPGDTVWGGGALPDGVTTVAYTFPDGHREQATVRNGFWVMQYFSPKAFTDGNYYALDPIKITLDGPGGQRTVPLEWGTHTCNQVSHGC